MPTAIVKVNVGSRERSAMVELRRDVKDRDEDGLVPTSFFRSVFVSTADSVVVFDARVTPWNGLERTTACTCGRSATRVLTRCAAAGTVSRNVPKRSPLTIPPN